MTGWLLGFTVGRTAEGEEGDAEEGEDAGDEEELVAFDFAAFGVFRVVLP